MSKYALHLGDTLSQISQTFNTTAQGKIAKNNTKNPNSIMTGTFFVANDNLSNTDTIKINGKIEDTKQSKTNDCWLLSGVNALRETDWGRQIISEAILKTTDGNVEVNLKGANKKIKVTKNEIIEAKKTGLYAQGDDDMIALEIAVNKHKNDIKPQSKEERERNGLAINYGEGEEVMYLLTGRKSSVKSLDPQRVKKDRVKTSSLDVENTLERKLKDNDSIAITCGFAGFKNKIEIDGILLSPGHAYSIKRIEKDTSGKTWVILIDPNNSAKELKVSQDKFVEKLDKLDALESPNEAPLKEKELKFNFKNLKNLN